jgi:hypothetical protein
MRYAKIRCSSELLISMMKEGYETHVKVIENGLPQDARFKYAFQFDGWVYLVVESDSFDDIKEGDKIPELDAVTFEAVNMDGLK